VAQASTYLVSDGAAATCLTATTTARLPAVLLAAAHAALLNARMLTIAPGAHPTFRQMMPPFEAIDDHGVKPVKVLKKAGLRPETPADWHSGDAVHALYKASLPLMPQSLYSDSEAASDDDASVVDSDSDAS
jgi:hypothetical protein